MSNVVNLQEYKDKRKSQSGTEVMIRFLLKSEKKNREKMIRQAHERHLENQKVLADQGLINDPIYDEEIIL